jgi:hypothetical protein
MGLHKSMAADYDRSHWPIDLRDVPTLLMMLDDYGVPVEIGIEDGVSAVAIRAAGVRCRCQGGCVRLEGPEACVDIQLNRLTSARALRSKEPAGGTHSLQLFAESSRRSLTITGPRPGQCHGAELWAQVLEALECLECIASETNLTVAT